jgi:hypothetical protein
MSDQKQAEKWINRVVDGFSDSFIDMEKEECEAILEIVKNWSPTNCWYMKFWMKDAIILGIESRLHVLGYGVKAGNKQN